MDEDSTTNQRPCNHGWWPEANVGQQYRKRMDRLVRQMLTVPIKSLLWDPDPGPSSPSGKSRKVRMDPGRDPTAGLGFFQG